MIGMKRIGRHAPTGAVLLGLVFLSVESGAENRKIPQAEKKIVVDGHVEEWQEIPSFPVMLRPSGGEIMPSDDIAVAARFTFDAKRFYAAVEVRDERFEFPDRSWRYGDGFLLTFIDPADGNAGSRFVTFGFSQIEDRAIPLLLNRDGTYFPPASLQDVDFEVGVDEKKGLLSYEIAIPFPLLTPMRPFIHGSWGINLVYADRDGEERELLQLYPDPGYDAEMTNLRRGEVFDFVLRDTRLRPEIQGVMSASHYTDGERKTLILSILNPGDGGEWTLRYNLSSAKLNRAGRAELPVVPGRNRIEWDLEEEGFPSASYVLSVGVIDAQGSLRFTQDNPFFVLNLSELEGLAQSLEQARKGELFSTEERFRSSFPSVEFRLKSVEEFLAGAYPYLDMNRLHQEFVDLEFLVGRISEGKPALFLPGRIGRLAHRSGIDGSLQPYSVYVPEFYDGEEALPLYVTLHGSGVDERQTIKYVAQTLLDFRMRGKAGRFIVLAPQGRGLSDWYLGDAGTDVMECIDHVKTLYKIDEKRIMLDGFSMGGYGAWRLGLSYPEVFRAVVVRSGAVSPPSGIEGGEEILDLMRPGITNSYFVVHGDRDNAVPVAQARSAVEKMERTGIDHRYIEIKDAAHSGYDKWDDILGWLKRKVGWEDPDFRRRSPRKKRPLP